MPYLWHTCTSYPWVNFALSKKYKTRLKRLARDKLFILFCLIVGDEEKRLRLTPGGQRRQS
jgi:hypothetical protein